ncbi:hypothetical protein C5167_046361 [Papaver somniferum]|uniref:Transcription factor CBF/NF-Y/archaeal histone domain-containing protein n=1 Tax=Papaver somniferum TaxID=3469 RepID=A0A4Y7LHE7_PAPSO|nr:hypothetical protein C5167_046361 [Papaver somniferum]
MAEAPTSSGGGGGGGGGSHESGGEQSPRSSNVREQDRYLPIANISRIMKKALPANGKIAKDSKETVQECVSEFISFITSEASDKCQKEKRKTINGDDLLWAMATLGFEDYIDPLKVYLSRYREGDTKGSAKGGDGSAKKDGAGRVLQNPQLTVYLALSLHKSRDKTIASCSTPLRLLFTQHLRSQQDGLDLLTTECRNGSLSCSRSIGHTTAATAETWALLLASRVVIQPIGFMLHDLPWYLLGMISEAKELLANIPHSTLYKVYREANQVADSLARSQHSAI